MLEMSTFRFNMVFFITSSCLPFTIVCLGQVSVKESFATPVEKQENETIKRKSGGRRDTRASIISQVSS